MDDKINQPKAGRWRRNRIRLIVYTSILAVAGAVFLGGCFVSQMPGTTHSGPLPELASHQAVVADHLRAHVVMLAETIGERNVHGPRYAMLCQAESYIRNELASYGYSVGAQTFKTYGQKVSNLEAERPGMDRPGEILIIGAHYDSAIDCPAANDNGTGVAGLLEIARLFADRSYPRTIRFVAFVNEEPPFFQDEQMGSLVYAKRCADRKENIVGMISLETIGYYSDEEGSQQYPPLLNLYYPSVGNFLAFVGNLDSRAFVHRSIALFRAHASFPSEGVAAPDILPGIGWSDHWAFWQQGYPALMVTDTAPFRYAHYHKASDTPDKIDYERTARVVTGMADVVAELACDK